MVWRLIWRPGMTNPVQRRDWISNICLRTARFALGAAFVLVLSLVATQSAQTQTYTVLYAFKGAPDGALPLAGVVRDETGNIYGTTYWAGTSQNCTGGCGIVFKLGPDGEETVLHSFSGSPANDGSAPNAPVVLDGKGNLYGTTYQGGVGNYQGTVFKLDSRGKEIILHSFAGPPGDGAYPFLAGLVRDEVGNFYGTTASGGSNYLLGTIVKVDKTGKETVLYSLGGASLWPFAGLARDKDGNLYGTSFGDAYSTYGTVFRLSKVGKFTVLYTFTGGADGSRPESVLVRDRAGNLYGTTAGGGDLNCSGSAFAGCGVVFKLGPHGKFTVLHAFTGTEGKAPRAGLVLDKMGNLYGTASEGGPYGNGTLFTVPFKKAPCKLTVLHSFAGGVDGAVPYGDLVWDTAGSLYGTTAAGGDVTCITSGFGDGCGTVFKFTPLARQRHGRGL